MTEKRFVKSAETSTSAANSRAQLEKILRRYGCTGFGSSTDYQALTVAVTFRVPDRPGGAQQVPVRLVISIPAIAAAMYGALRGNQTWRGSALEQAERVAWRNLVLWVDAACSAAAAGMQTMGEAFFAHVLVKDADGHVGRMVDYARTLGSDEAVQRALPAAGGSSA